MSDQVLEREAHGIFFGAVIDVLDDNEGFLDPDAEHPKVYEAIERVVGVDKEGLGLNTEHAFAILALAISNAQVAYSESIKIGRLAPEDFHG